MNRLLTIVAVLLFCTTGLTAGIKDRFAKRLPLINKLKETLIVGENNKGYLEVRSNQIKPADKSVMEAENADRNKVYAMLATKTNVDIKVIEKRRAKQIAKKSKTGIWLQKEDGTWYKK